MNFPESSLANLSSLGYTEDEARFLYLVATHSGYFSMRQFLQFTGTKSGDKSMAFSQKLLGRGHATARSFLRNGLVYHLFSRIVYRAIGRENLRNRRAHSLEHIRTRLVALDFVLAHLHLGETLRIHRENSSFRGPDDFVFCKKDGSPLDPDVLRKDALYPILDRLGIPRKKGASGFHTFRHSASALSRNDPSWLI
jgi:hypothetical protein